MLGLRLCAERLACSSPRASNDATAQAIGLAVDNAMQWKHVAKEAAQTVLVVVLLDRIGFRGGEPWLESYCDTLSVQASLFRGRAVGWWENTRRFMEHTSRIELKGS